MKKLHKSEDPFLGEYNFYYAFLLNSSDFKLPEYVKSDFSDGKLEKVEKYFSQVSESVSVESCDRDYFKVNGLFYISKKTEEYVGANSRSILMVNSLEEVDILRYNRLAQKRLFSFVEEDLTLGDKLILSNIAKEHVKSTLEYACETGEITHIFRVIYAPNSENVRRQLKEYGFTLPKDLR